MVLDVVKQEYRDVLSRRWYDVKKKVVGFSTKP